ncbi:MAG TPA: hypothetical protein VH599_16045 [Ktedonobacterales bacterium]
MSYLISDNRIDVIHLVYASFHYFLEDFYNGKKNPLDSGAPGPVCPGGMRPGASPAQTPSPTAPTTPTPRPSPLELSFLGSDGNVWEMAWPQGATGAIWRPVT